MSSSEQPTIETLFNHLDRWRHFAGYPLEPRVDALFGLFLPKVIEDCCGVEEMHSQVIPQFPLKQSETNRSDKVDFLALSKDGGRAFLIELKTDMDSLRGEQNDYLNRAQKRELACILSDFKKVAGGGSVSPNDRLKYFHLITALCEMGLLKVPNKLEEKIRKGRKRESKKLICDIEVLSSSTTPKVIFVQPTRGKLDDQDGFDHIYFNKFADSIEGHGKLGCLFASYLRRWETEAGKCPPEKV